MKKALKIIGVSLLICGSIAICVLYGVKPNETKQAFANIWDFLNKPLPIVGLTTLGVLIFVWRLVFATRYGKKALEKVEKEYKDKYDELKVEKENLELERNENKKKIEDVENGFVALCKIIPNKKVNELGETFERGLEYGEERIDSETKAN